MKKILISCVALMAVFSCQTKSASINAAHAEQMNLENHRTPANTNKCQSVAESIIAMATSRTLYCPGECNVMTYLSPLTKNPMKKGAVWTTAEVADVKGKVASYAYDVQSFFTPKDKERSLISKHNVQLDHNCYLISIQKIPN